MTGFLQGSIFRSSFLLAFSGALLLAIASLSVIFTTPVPFDFPVSTLDVSRALEGKSFTEQGAPLVVRQSASPGIKAGRKDIVTSELAGSIARQLDVPADAILMAFADATGDYSQRQFDVARRKYEEQMLQAARLYRGDKRFNPLIFGSFRVALRLPNGDWRIVSRTPAQPRWQYNAIKGILIALLLMIPLAWWFSRKLAAPIHALGDSANRIGSGLHEAVKVEGPREVQQAATAMNQMQARIRAQINERAEMLAAIAHDLRTPLARLSFLLGDQSFSNRNKIDEEIAEMDRMIATAMDYVRSETVEPMRENIDLRLLLESIIDDFVDLGHAAMLHSGSSIIVSADPVMLRRILTNVIGNAVTYGNKARVKAHKEGDAAVIEVRDEGPGMSEDDILRAFDPYFRAEPSRNVRTGGVGLGLAIAKRGVEAHAGNIEIRNGQNGGLVVSIVIPRQYKQA